MNKKRQYIILIIILAIILLVLIVLGVMLGKMNPQAENNSVTETTPYDDVNITEATEAGFEETAPSADVTFAAPDITVNDEHKTDEDTEANESYQPDDVTQTPTETIEPVPSEPPAKEPDEDPVEEPDEKDPSIDIVPDVGIGGLPILP